MAYASYATLSEAWGIAGDPSNVVSTPAPAIDPPSARPHSPSTPFNPSPSDVDYSSAGAPILDDIVNLYTPADTGGVGRAHGSMVTQVPRPAPLPSEALVIQGKVTRPATRVAPPPKRRFKRMGDDYESDGSGSDSDSQVVDRRRRRDRPQSQRLIPSVGDSTQTIELAAYVLSGVLLIFLFESFISIGSSMRVASYY